MKEYLTSANTPVLNNNGNANSTMCYHVTLVWGKFIPPPP